MSVERISERYARSLFEVAKEQQVLLDVHQDMHMVAELCASSLPLRRFLSTPIIRPERKLNILQLLFSNSLHKISMQFIGLLTRKGRSAYLQSLASAFVDRYQIYKGQISAQLLTSHSITTQEKKQFLSYIAKLTQKEVLLSTEVRPQLLGGFVIRVNDQQIDKSVATQLRDLKKSLTQRSSAI